LVAAERSEAALGPPWFKTFLPRSPRRTQRRLRPQPKELHHEELNGFRNKDLRRWLHPQSDEADPQTRRREAGRTTRCIKLLRAHGLVRKVAKENRYTLTAQGQKFASALLSASAVDIKGLTKLAA
jgi:hypothetical protein